MNELISTTIILQASLSLALALLSIIAKPLWQRSSFYLAAGWGTSCIYVLLLQNQNSPQLSLIRAQTDVLFLLAGIFGISFRPWTYLRHRPWLFFLVLIAFEVIAIGERGRGSGSLALLLLLAVVLRRILALASVFFLLRRAEKSVFPSNPAFLSGSFGVLLLLILQPLVMLQAYKAITPTVLGNILLSTVSYGLTTVGMMHLLASRVRALENYVPLESALDRMLHELGTPVAELHVFAERARSSGHAVNAERLEATTQRIVAILDASKSLLLNSRGEEEAPLGDFRRSQSLNSIVQGALMVVKATRSGRVRFAVQYARLPPVACSPSRLSQAMINVLNNAFDAIEKRGSHGMIDVRTFRSQGDERSPWGFCTVVFTDDGGGISDHEWNHMFNEGFSTKPGPGRGHGLALAHEVITEHGGFIEAWNIEVPKGLAVGIALPPALEESRRHRDT